MEDQGIHPTIFLATWHKVMLIGAIIMTAFAILTVLYHNLRISMIRDYHKKYEYVNSSEIRTLKLCFVFIGIAAAMMVNRYGMNSLTTVEVWFFVRLFMSVAVGTLVAYVAYLVLEYYWPTRVNRKLRRWRYLPRVNAKNGRKMRLLSEDEEDVHLDEGMKAEENIFSIDYDVWIDESTGDLKIEKYPGHLQALQCGSCGFFTMKVMREEVTVEPRLNEPGELVKHYQCSYCKAVRATSFRISTKEQEDYKSEKHVFRKNRDIEVVKIEVSSSLKGKKHYEFESVDQAKQFLEEFDLDNS